jgi:Fe-S-cluster-containing hydrogenase component 2
MKESTRIALRKHGWRVDRFVHHYLYFRFYYPYVKATIALLPSLNYLRWFKPMAILGKAIFNRYHSKVLSSSDARKILSIDEDIFATTEENKQIIPFKYAHKIILKEADVIVVMDCPCKRSTGAPASLINSCLGVGRDVASFWLEHCGKYNPRVITQDQAVALIKTFRESGHITQAFFKVATGGSTGVICNCHPDTCVSLIATRLARKLDPGLSMTAESGYSVSRDSLLCKSCEICANTCQFDAIDFSNGVWTYDRHECLGCEHCVESCPNQALSLYRDPEKTLPLDLDLVKERFLSCPGAS